MNYTKHLTATNTLVALCVITFIAANFFTNTLYSSFVLFYIESPAFHPIQFVSHMFLHGSIMHLLFNMLALWMFGAAIERAWGAQRFLIFYFTCGLGAVLIYQAVNYYQFQSAIAPFLGTNISYETLINTFSTGQYYAQYPSSEQAGLIFVSRVVGASGAIYGVLLAFACLFPNHKIMLIFLPVPIAAKFFVPALLCFDLFSGVTGFSIFGGNIAHAAHIGGAATGAVFILFMLLRKRVL